MFVKTVRNVYRNILGTCYLRLVPSADAVSFLAHQIQVDWRKTYSKSFNPSQLPIFLSLIKC